MAKNQKEKDPQNLFRKLTTLFRSGPVIKRKIKTADTTIAVADKTKSSGTLLFQKSLAPTYATITANAYNLSERLMRYQDFQEMEYTPEIAAALDIYADETCLSGDSIVPLLDGTKPTMRQLFEESREGFWVYSYDISTGKIVPGKATKVIKTGVKKLYKVMLDDGTCLRLTDNHRVLLSNNTYVEVKDLIIGDSLRSLYTKLSSSIDYIQGYEQILEKESWRYTHRMVAEHFQPKSKGVVHHVDFNKRNNEPSNLQFMTRKDHKDLHANSNHLRWELNSEYSAKMSAIFSNIAKNRHKNEDYTKQLLERRDEVFASYDKETRKNVFGRPGSQNGMHQNGVKISGNKNGKWNNDFIRTVSKQQIVNWINEGKTANDVCNELPMRFEDLQKSMHKVGIFEWSQKHIIDASTIILKLNEWRSKQPVNQNLHKKFVKAREFADITIHQAYLALNALGYKSWSDYLNRTNHRVISITEEKEEDVFDLEVKEWHNFAVSATQNSTSYVFVHNCAQDDKGRVLHIYSDNEKIKEILEDLFYNTLNTEFNLRSWARNLVKYGDFFLYNDVSPEYGVVSAFPIPVNEIEREENFDRNDPFAVRYRWVTLGNRVLENWEVTHFRLLGNDMFLPYGSSVIEPARRIWRQLILIEDAMLVYRVVRAPERRVFYIDVANIPASDVPLYVEEQRKNLRTNQVIDRTTGRVDLRYNPLSVDEDYFVPVRGLDTGTKIETLAGGQNTAAVEDVAYIQKKLFAALKVPRAYLGYDEMLSSKATLAQEDIRFSRTINVIQRVLLAELNKLAIIHLYAHGYDGEDLQNFTLRLSNPSTVAQQQKLELWRSKFEIGGSAPEGYVNKDFVRKEIWGLNDEECKRIDDGRLKDKMVDQTIESAQAEGGEDETGGGGGGEDLFGGGGEEEPEATGGEEETPPEENAGEEPEEETEPDKELITSAIDLDDDEDFAIKLNVRDVEVPVKAQRQLDKVLYNRSRLRTHGASKTHMPDFKKMTSTDNRSMQDPYDMDWIKSVVSNPFAESRDYVKTNLPPDLMSALGKWSKKHGLENRNAQGGLLNEANYDVNGNMDVLIIDEGDET